MVRTLPEPPVLLRERLVRQTVRCGAARRFLLRADCRYRLGQRGQVTLGRRQTGTSSMYALIFAEDEKDYVLRTRPLLAKKLRVFAKQ